jgi:hypothetical protein
MERWKPCPDFPLYEISDHGRIRRRETGEIHLLAQNRHGYVITSLCRYVECQRERRTAVIAPLVAKAFLPPRPPNHQLHHIDHDKLNNHASNLCWVTQSQNVLASYSTGTRRTGRRYSMTPEQHAIINFLFMTGELSRVQIAEIVGCTTSAVSKILSGKTKCRWSA